jgi:O-antigen/teichoic acid export membrane protein
MKKEFKKLAAHPVISGSFIIFAGGMVGNVFNFLFNLLMSRNLPVAEYGTLISLISLITLLTIPAGSITPTVVAVAGEFFAKNKNELVKSLFLKLFKPMFLVGVLFIICFAVFSGQLTIFLNINGSYLLLISSFIIFLSYIGVLNTAFLQAKLSFVAISVSSALSSTIKLVLGFLLVIIGYGLNGALIAYLLSFFTPIVVGFVVMRRILTFKTIKPVSIPTKGLISFGIPSAIVIFCLNSFISTDIILVKHLFDPQKAGLYAGISLIGRVIFYITAPIITVMFPIITNRFNRNEAHKNILFTSVALVGVASFAIALFYFLFPQFTILFFLKRTEYLAGVGYLGIFGVFIALYSLVSLLSYYFLSIKKTKISGLLVTGAIAQALFIYLFHANFSQVIYVCIITMSVLLVSLLYYYRFRINSFTANE